MRLSLLLAGVPILEPTGEEGFHGPAYKVDLFRDRFVHFTTPAYAAQIKKSKKLLKDPPGVKKFGGDSVYAVSLEWGRWQPGVQTTHIGKSLPLVAVLFTTSKVPKVGFPEEVIWDSDVPLSTVAVVPVAQALRQLKKTTSPKGDFWVTYQ